MGAQLVLFWLSFSQKMTSSDNFDHTFDRTIVRLRSLGIHLSEDCFERE